MAATTTPTTSTLPSHTQSNVVTLTFHLTPAKYQRVLGVILEEGEAPLPEIAESANCREPLDKPKPLVYPLHPIEGGGLKCEEPGCRTGVILPYYSPSGYLSAEEVAKMTLRRVGREMCADCFKKQKVG